MDVIASVVRAAAGVEEEPQVILEGEKQLSDGPSAPVLLEPAKMASVSLSSDALPAILPPSVDLCSALENFEIRAADFEAEDRLEQLALEDELSDVRIHEGAMATGGVSILEGAVATGGVAMAPDTSGTDEETKLQEVVVPRSKEEERNVEGEMG